MLLESCLPLFLLRLMACGRSCLCLAIAEAWTIVALCCTQDRMIFACRSFNLLLSGSWYAGNIMEACRVKWITDRIDFKSHPFLAKAGFNPNDQK